MLQDHFLHAIDIGEDIVIPKTDNAPSTLLEPRGPPLIVSVIGVLAAICFDDEATFKANEINNEGT